MPNELTSIRTYVLKVSPKKPRQVYFVVGELSGESADEAKDDDDKREGAASSSESSEGGEEVTDGEITSSDDEGDVSGAKKKKDKKKHKHKKKKKNKEKDKDRPSRKKRTHSRYVLIIRYLQLNLIESNSRFPLLPERQEERQ